MIEIPENCCRDDGQGGTLLSCRITPKSSKSAISGGYRDAVKINIAAPPEDGKANRELIVLLSQRLKMPKSSISLIRGEASRDKCVQIVGLSPGQTYKLLTL